MRYVSAQSRHDSGVCTCLDESGLCLSILVYLLGLIFVFLSHLLLLVLFILSILFLHALAFIFSVARSFSLPEFSFFQSERRHGMSCVTPRWSCGALPGVAALGSVARRSSASPGSAPMRV